MGDHPITTVLPDIELWGACCNTTIKASDSIWDRWCPYCWEYAARTVGILVEEEKEDGVVVRRFQILKRGRYEHRHVDGQT